MHVAHASAHNDGNAGGSFEIGIWGGRNPTINSVTLTAQAEAQTQPTSHRCSCLEYTARGARVHPGHTRHIVHTIRYMGLMYRGQSNLSMQNA